MDLEKIAREFGCEVAQFNFNGIWPKKKNWALENLPFKYEWVLIVDADEVFGNDAPHEFQEILANDGNGFDGYWINRRFMFMGRWLKHAYYPNWNLRLFRHRMGRYERLSMGATGSGDKRGPRTHHRRRQDNPNAHGNGPLRFPVDRCLCREAQPLFKLGGRGSLGRRSQRDTR